MVQLVLLVGKVVFLLVLYAFVFFVVRSITRDLRAAALSAPLGSTAREVDKETRKALRRAASAGELVGDALPPRDWSLVVRNAPRRVSGEIIPIPREGSVVVGRAPDCDLELPDTFVSSHHARLRVSPEGLVIEDLGSTNGTFVNGVQIDGPLLLQPGDELGIGDGVFVVEGG